MARSSRIINSLVAVATLGVVASTIATAAAAAAVAVASDNDNDATVATVAPGANPGLSERQSILANLKDRTLRGSLGPADILDYLRRLGGDFVDPELGQIQRLIDVAAVAEDKCTKAHSQHLIRLLVSFHTTPLGAYLDAYRADQKALCAATYAGRLDRAIGALNGAHKAKVQGLLKGIRKRTPLINLVAPIEDEPLVEELALRALRQYDASVEQFVAQGIADRPAREYAAQLREACHSVVLQLDDYLWTLRLLADEPAAASEQLDDERREWLEATKVCATLEPDQLARSIRAKLAGRGQAEAEADGAPSPADLARLRAFGKYLTVDTVGGAGAGQLQSSAATLAELSVADSREALKRYLNGQKAGQNRRGHSLGSFCSLDDELEASCRALQPQLGPYLWLLERGYARGLDEALVGEYLVPLKACQYAVLAS